MSLLRPLSTNARCSKIYLFSNVLRQFKTLAQEYIFEQVFRLTVKNELTTKKNTTKLPKLNPQKKKKKKKNRSRIKSINSKKLLIRLRILLAQLKAGNNSKLLKNLNQTNTISFVSAQ